MRSESNRWWLPLAALAVVGWLAWDTPPVRQALQWANATLWQPARRAAGAVEWPEKASGTLGTSASTRSATRPERGARSEATARKCIGPGTPVVYTNDACPPGTRAQALSGGTVTVLPAAPVAPPAAASAATLRDLVMKPGEKTLKEMAVDRAADSIR